MYDEVDEREKNKVWLRRDEDWFEKGREVYDLSCDDRLVTGEEFEPLAYRIIQLLTQDRVVSYYAEYACLKPPRKLFLLGWRPPVFATDDGPTKLKQQLDASVFHGVYGMHRVCKTEKNFWYEDRSERRFLCIIQERLDLKLLRATDFSLEGEADSSCITAVVFPESSIKRQATPEDTIAYYWERDDYLMEIRTGVDYPELTIYFPPGRASFQPVLEMIRQAVGEFGLTLHKYNVF